MMAALAFASDPVSARHDKDKHADNGNVSDTGTAQPPHSISGISKDQAIQIAQRRYKARVVRAEAAESSGRRVYVLRMLSEEGRVWTVRMDAQTGGEL